MIFISSKQSDAIGKVIFPHSLHVGFIMSATFLNAEFQKLKLSLTHSKKHRNAGLGLSLTKTKEKLDT